METNRKTILTSKWGTAIRMMHTTVRPPTEGGPRPQCIHLDAGTGCTMSLDLAIVLQDALWKYIQEAQAAEEAES